MGLIFNRKTKSGATINKKFIADRDLHNSDIKKISRSIGIYKKGGQREIAKIFIRDQKGGLKTKEAHDALQELIGKKLIANTAQARSIGKKLGLKGKRILKFDNLTKYNQKLRASEAKNNGSESKNESFSNRQSQLSENHPKEAHKDYRAIENKTQEISSASATKLSTTDNSLRSSMKLSSKNYLQNSGDKNNVISGKIGDSLGKKTTTIYDIIRSLNQENKH